jgi:renalase
MEVPQLVPMNSVQPPVIIIGAGLAGLVAANTLLAAGRRSVVLDKGRTVGGRLATRRMIGAEGRTARLDHGAQFFTVRSPDFAEIVHDWRRVGLVREWCRGFNAEIDGYPRYCAEAGMNTIAKYLAASVDVQCDVSIRAVAGNDGVLSVSTEDGQRWESNTVLLTPPVPQSLALCQNGWLPIPEDVEAELEKIVYAQCIALLVTIDGASDVSLPGGKQLRLDEDEVFSFVADNAMKGISEVGALTFHVNDAVSAERYDEDDEETRTYLLSAAKPFIGGASILNVELKKWRYARPLVNHPHSHVCVSPIDDTHLLFAGDGFLGSKIEGAALSGLAAAETILLNG